jgi:hypothetical protein
MQNAEIHREHLPSLPPNTAPLWAGIIGVPAIWVISLQAVYALSPVACAHHRLWILHTLHIAGLILVAIGGLICLRYWKRDGDDQNNRTRFLASWGMLSSSLFFLLILAQTIAGFMLDPCAS